MKSLLLLLKNPKRHQTVMRNHLEFYHWNLRLKLNIYFLVINSKWKYILRVVLIVLWRSKQSRLSTLLFTSFFHGWVCHRVSPLIDTFGHRHGIKIVQNLLTGLVLSLVLHWRHRSRTSSNSISSLSLLSSDIGWVSWHVFVPLKKVTYFIKISITRTDFPFLALLLSFLKHYFCRQ